MSSTVAQELHQAPRGASTHRGGRSFLAAVLVAAGLLELLLYRVLRPLLRSEADVVPAALVRATEFSATLLVSLVSVLGLLLLAGALWRLVWPGLLHNLLARLSFSLVGVVYLILGAGLLAAPGAIQAVGLGTARTQVLLQVSFVCLAFLLVASVAPLPAPGRLKAGLALWLLPLLCHFYTYWSVARSAVYPGQMDVLGLGQALLGVAGALTAVCFLPWPPPRGSAFALATAGLVVLCAGGLCMVDSELLARLVHAATGVRLPPSRPLQFLYLFSLGSFLYAVVLLILHPGALRLRGLGLLLLGIGGYQIQEPHRMGLLLLGLFALLRSAQLWPRATSPSSRSSSSSR